MHKISFLKKVHAKIFEIVLIVGFVICEIFLIVNLAVNNWFLKYSSSILAFEVLLVLFTFFCLIISIILRIFRSNGTVFNSTYNISYYISIAILILVIINILFSVDEDALFYYVYAYITFSENNLEDYESRLKIRKAFQKIMNKYNGEGRALSNDDEDYYDDEEYHDDEGENDFEKKIKRLKALPWVSFNLNAFVQILAIFIILLLIKRIKDKSDYGISIQNSQQNTTQNQMVNIKNSRTGSSDRKSKGKSKSKRLKHKKDSKRQNYLMIQEPESDDQEEKLKRKKKGKKKKK